MVNTPAEGEEVTLIQVGNETMESIELHFGPGGGIDPSLSIPISNEGPVISSRITISSVEDTAGPGRISIDVGMDGRDDWGFGGGEYGSLGSQSSFSNGHTIHRLLLDEETSSIEVLVPEDAIINDSWLSLSSPPVTEVENRILLRSLDEDIDVNAFDLCDIDGDSEDELIFFSISDSKIYLVDDAADTLSTVTVVKEDVEWVSCIRGMEQDLYQRGGMIVQYSIENNDKERVSFIEQLSGETFGETTLTTGLSRGEVGFQLMLSHEGSKDTVIVLDDDQSGIHQYGFDRSGSVSKQMIMDKSIPFTGIGASDLNGDDILDIIQFPENDEKNITVQMSISNGEGSGVTLFDMGHSSNLFGPGTSVDIDGNGMQEFFFPVGIGSDIAVISMAGDKPQLTWLGLNTTGSVPRSLPRQSYGDSGVYDGGEAFLYLVSMEGISQVMPVSSVDGTYLVSSIDDVDSPGIIGDVRGNENGNLYVFEGGTGIFRNDLKWTSIEEPILGIGDIGMDIDISNENGVPVHIHQLFGNYPSGEKDEDDFGNNIRRISLDINGSGGFLVLNDLEIEYEIDFDTMNTPGFLSSVKRTAEAFDGSFIPFMVKADSEGSVRVGPAVTVYDAPPKFMDTLPRRITIQEGSMGNTILNLRDHVEDDLIDFRELNLEITPVNEIPSGLLFIDRNGGVISHAYEYPDLHGSFEFMVRISDMNSYTHSEIIELLIEPVQDPPRVNERGGEIIIHEGITHQLILAGEGGLFSDPDEDKLDFTFRILSSDPPELRSQIGLDFRNDVLDITPSVKGIGGIARLEITATDHNTGDSDLPVSIKTLRIINEDARPWIETNPGSIVLSEDQDTPTKVSLKNWFIDPDTHLSEYQLLSYSSNPRLKTYFELSGNSPTLFLIPTGELVGEVTVWVELTGHNSTLTDRILVDIRPVNDLPITTIDSVEYKSKMGWILRGHVDDPDDSGGRIEYRIGSGEWRDAWGFNTWSFLVEESMVPGSGIYVSVRADDGNGPSTATYTKLLWPYIPPTEIPVPDDPTNNDQISNPDPGNSKPYAPDDPDSTDPPWIIAGGIGALAAGLLIFLLLSEVGFVTLVTALISIYSKLSKKDILNHEIRGLIRGYIIANPGDHYSSIKRNLDLNNGTLAYHLRVLEQNGFIKSMYDGIYKRYYPANINISKLKKNVAKQEEIVNIILDNPGVTMEQIGRMIGVSRQVVNYHVKNLIRGGVVTYSRDQKSARFYPTENTPNVGVT